MHLPIPQALRPHSVVTACLLAGCLAAASSVAAQPVPARTASAPHVAVELIAAQEALRPGANDVGLRFVLEPGWHVYWVNPGDSGAPPEVRWQLPVGVTAGPIDWPLPERIDDAGSIGYGYRGEVVLPVTVTVEAAAASTPALLAATVRWLVCKDMCLAGGATLGLAQPIASTDRAQVTGWREAIVRARAQVPLPAPKTWKVTATSARDSFQLDVVTGRRESGGRFFPLNMSQVDDGAPPLATPLDAGIRFTLRKSAQLVQDPRTLPGIVVFSDGRAFAFDAPVVR